MSERCVTDKQMSDIKHGLLGTCKSVTEILAFHDLEDHLEEVEERLLDGNDAVELCSACEWWHEPGELTFVDKEGKAFCPQCLGEDAE